MVGSTVYLSESKENCEKVKHALCFTLFIGDDRVYPCDVKVRRMECSQEQYGVFVNAETQSALDIIKGFVAGFATGWNHRNFLVERKPDKKQNKL